MPEMPPNNVLHYLIPIFHFVITYILDIFTLDMFSRETWEIKITSENKFEYHECSDNET